MNLQAHGEAPMARVGSDHVLNPIGVRMQFAADEEIYGQEEAADLIYLVAKGVVRTSRLLRDGRRQIGDFYYPGDILGVEAGDTHGFAADALTDTTLIVAKRSAVHHCGDDRERLERLISAATARELARAQEHLLVLGRRSACEKVASFLLAVAQRVQGDLTPLAMSRQDMADYLGLTIETVSRMLTQLQANGLVRFVSHRAFQVTHPAGLARLAAA